MYKVISEERINNGSVPSRKALWRKKDLYIAI